MFRSQLPLFDDGLFSSVQDRGLVEQFKSFHYQNPHVYEGLKRLALKMRETGRKSYGIGGLFEVLRWDRALKTTDEEFKLNNSYRSFYARLLMHTDHRLSGFFRTRRSVADES